MNKNEKLYSEYREWMSKKTNRSLALNKVNKKAKAKSETRTE